MLAANFRRHLMLGIETSFDDTSIALVARTPDGRADIRANLRQTQV